MDFTIEKATEVLAIPAEKWEPYTKNLPSYTHGMEEDSFFWFLIKLLILYH